MEQNITQDEFDRVAEEHKKWMICTEDMKILPDKINTFKGTISRAHFNSVMFDKINFSNVDLSFAKFTNCSFHDCDFNHANLTYAEFYLCDFTEQKLSNAYLFQAKVKDCYGYDKKEMKEFVKTFPDIDHENDEIERE